MLIFRSNVHANFLISGRKEFRAAVEVPRENLSSRLCGFAGKFKPAAKYLATPAFSYFPKT
jgi:hypothetical protein